jgi:glycosyltransferase involved in cell wall biosynthesis
VLVCFWWDSLPRLLDNVSARRVVLCIYDHVSWCRTSDDARHLYHAIQRSDVLAVANERIAEDIRNATINPHKKPVFIVEDGVDTELFQPLPLPTKHKIGWCGDSSLGYGQIKGLNLIVEACDRAGVDLQIADRCNHRVIPGWQMPGWYKDISVYLNASYSDGTPNPPLEAMACGRPVISTRVGIMPRVIRDGFNGWLVDRNADAISRAITAATQSDLQTMGKAARMTAEANDWSTKIGPWRACLEAAARPPAKPSRTPRRPRGLMVADVPGWAFDINQQDAAKYCDSIDWDHWFVIDRKSPPPMSKYDFVFLPFHRWGLNHYWWGAPVLGSLRSQWLDPNKPGEIPEMDRLFIRRCAGFHVVHQGGLDALKEFENVVYLTNPVNMKRFPKQTAVKGIVAEWNGNAGHFSGINGDVKGYHSIIVEACKKTKTRLKTAEFSTMRLPPERMGDFYCQSSVALCASKYEGASNSVMEAMASGLALLCTDVGNHREMQESQLEHFGETGIQIVDRSPEAFSEALSALKPSRVAEMGEINRQEIQERWSWDAWRDCYTDFFRMAL